MCCNLLYFTEDYNEQEEQQVNGDVDANEPKKCDIIRITGKRENCEAAKQALHDLVPVTVEVSYHYAHKVSTF